MGNLHIVNKSPFNSKALNEAFNACSDGDTLILIDDGIYTDKNTIEALNAQHNKSISYFYLDDSCALRGISPPFQQISMATMVELSINSKHCLSWF